MLTTIKNLYKVWVGAALPFILTLFHSIVIEGYSANTDTWIQIVGYYVGSVVVSYLGYHIACGIKKDVDEYKNRKMEVAKA